MFFFQSKLHRFYLFRFNKKRSPVRNSDSNNKVYPFVEFTILKFLAL